MQFCHSNVSARMLEVVLTITVRVTESFGLYSIVYNTKEHSACRIEFRCMVQLLESKFTNLIEAPVSGEVDE